MACHCSYFVAHSVLCHSRTAVTSSNFVSHRFPKKNRIDSNVPPVCSRKVMNASKQINKRRYESCTRLPFSKWMWDRETGREGHLLLKVPGGRGRGIMEGIIASNDLLPHQTTMLSDTLDLFVSRVTEGLTDGSQTRGLGWLKTSLTRKESGWGATMEVERMGPGVPGAAWGSPWLCWILIYTELFLRE